MIKDDMAIKLGIILLQRNSNQSLGFACGSVVKNLPVSAGDTGLIPGSGRSPRGVNGNPLQYSSCLAGYSPRGCKELDMTEHITH